MTVITTRTQLDRFIAEEKRALDGMQHKDGPGAQRYRDAIKKLEDLRPRGWRDGIGREDRDKINEAAKDVGNARLFAKRENLPNDQYTRNQGDDPGIYRERGSGEVVRRDPGAKTAAEKVTTIQNRDEPGINRDRATGKIVSREPGAKTIQEKADETERYATSGKKVYRPGATTDQVQSGRSLREGDSGDGVRKMQSLLKAAGYDPGTADGYYGPKTAAAVKKFLADNNNAQGYVGAEEMGRLEYLARQRQGARA
jgi:hypothetical protein